MKKLILTSLAFGALSVAGGNASAADVYLCAGATTKVMANTLAVPMWGFAQVGTPAELVAGCSAGATIPGPQLKNVDDGLGLTIHLFNDGIPEPISIVIAGQTDTTMTPVFFPAGDPNYGGRLRSFTHETFDGTDPTNPTPVVTYTWNTLKPGSFAYQSGSHQAVQVQMGLYGAIIKDAVPATATALAQAYSTDPLVAEYEYDTDVTLFYSEVDSDLHFAIAGIDRVTGLPTTPTYGPPGPGITITSTVNYAPDYFLLNGEDIPTNGIPVGMAGETTLIRMINMGSKTRKPTFKGIYVDVVAEDGNLYPYIKEQYSVMLAAGKTKDALFGPTIASTIAFYDRRLFLTNEVAPVVIAPLAVGSNLQTQSVGTNISFLEVAAAVIDTDGDGIMDDVDNCTNVSNPRQIDADSDGYGNMCDADFDNDLNVNFVDYSFFGSKWLTNDKQADLNGDGTVNYADYAIFATLFKKAPGPSAVSNLRNN